MLARRACSGDFSRNARGDLCTGARDAILAAFQVETYGKDGAPVIEVTRLFISEIGDFSARSMVRGSVPRNSSRSVGRWPADSSILRDALPRCSLYPSPARGVPQGFFQDCRSMSANSKRH